MFDSLQLIFTDVTNNYIFTTLNYGQEFRETKVLFVPNEIYFHPHAPDTILAHEKETEDTRVRNTLDLAFFYG